MLRSIDTSKSKYSDPFDLIQVASIVPLRNLKFFRPPGSINSSPSQYSRAFFYLFCPANHIGVRSDIEEFLRLIQSANYQRSIPAVNVSIKKVVRGATSIHANQITNPPNIAPRLFPLPPTITIIQIINVNRRGL